MPTGSGPISPTPQNNCNGADRKSLDNNTNNSGHSNGGSKLSTMSQDHTLYVQRARVTRPAPPKPSANPMQFVQIKPCNLYQSAQEQLKRADEVKKVKEIKKEEPEDWQCNLDNWKSSRRKRVEHIIDRVVEVKKLELEEHDRTRRKSKTFSEMMEEKKGSRRPTKLAALPVYTEDESNDLSDFGIGTSSASGKSSLSEDYDNQSVMSDNIDNDKQSIDLDNNSNHENGGASRDYISSPGYDTSSSTAPASSPDPCEYTYEGAIEDYKTRISKTQTINYNNGFRHNSSAGLYSKDSTPERSTVGSSEPAIHHSRRMSGSKIEDRLMSFEIKSASDLQHETAVTKSSKKDLPKVDILKRRELFEKENGLNVVADQTTTTVCSVLIGQKRGDSNDFSNSKSIKERLSNLEKTKPAAALIDDTKKASNRLSGDISSIKDRLQILEKQNSQAEKSLKIEVPVVSLKDRLTSLHSAVAKEEVKKPVLLIDEHQLEMLKQEELVKQKEQRQQQLMSSLKEDTTTTDDENLHSSHEILNIQDESNVDTDREDSGIHTTDVSCSVSQTDEQPDLSNEESHHHINVDGLCPTHEDAALDATPIIIPDVVPAEIDSPALRVDDIIISHDAIEDASLSSITSPEPSNDLDASVSLSLSESPTSSSRTIIFDGGSNLVGEQKLITSEVVVLVEPTKLVDAGSLSSKNLTNKNAIVLTPSYNNYDKTNNETITKFDQANTEDSISSVKGRRKTVVEICEKRNINDYADPNNIPTPFVNVNYEDIGKEIPVIDKPKLESANVTKRIDITKPTIDVTIPIRPNVIEIPIESSSDIITEENGIIVAELEVITTKIKVRPTQSPTSTPSTPNINPRTHPLALKSKNIFDFIKNFNGNQEESSNNSVDGTNTISVDNSKFYPAASSSSSAVYLPRNEVNIQITKTIKTDKLLEKTDSIDSTNTMTSEINQLLDEELSKLTIEDTRL